MIQEMKIGQRWMFETERFKYIIELLQVNINNELKFHECKVVQVMRGALFKLGEVQRWRFNDLSTWTYLAGQDLPK